MFDTLNLDTLNTETILVLGIVIFVVLTLLGLVIWNSKTNRQVKTLSSIDESLKHMDTVVTETGAASVGILEGPEPAEAGGTPGQEGSETAESVGVCPDDAIATEELIEEAAAQPIDKFKTGKSGKVYTKEELEAQIR